MLAVAVDSCFGLFGPRQHGHNALFSGCVIISTYVQDSYIYELIGYWSPAAGYTLPSACSIAGLPMMPFAFVHWRRSGNGGAS